MKDADEPKKALYGLIYNDLIKKYPFVFNAALAISIIALIAATAFLVSDILSSNSDNAPAGLSGAFSFLSPLKNEQIDNSGTASINNSSLKNRESQLSPINKSEKEKGIDPGKPLNETSISAAQAGMAKNSKSKQLNYDSGKSTRKKKHKASKNNNGAIGGGASAPIASVKNSSYTSRSQGNMDERNNSYINNASINISNPSEVLAANNAAYPNMSEMNPAGNATAGLSTDSAGDRGDGAVVIPMPSFLNIDAITPAGETDDNASTGISDLINLGQNGSADLNRPLIGDSTNASAIESETVGMNRFLDAGAAANETSSRGVSLPKSVATTAIIALPEISEAVENELSQMSADSVTQEDSTSGEDGSVEGATQAIPYRKFSAGSRISKDDQTSNINKRNRNAKTQKRTAPYSRQARARNPTATRNRSRN